MAATDDFTVFVLNPAGLSDPALVVAGSRTGAIGVLNAETDMVPAAMRAALGRLAATRKPFGLKWSRRELPELWEAEGFVRPDWLILDAGRNAHLSAELQSYRAAGGRLLLELSAWRDELASLETRIDGWWVKGRIRRRGG